MTDVLCTCMGFEVYMHLTREILRCSYTYTFLIPFIEP